eukprot:SAG11_NODE_10901_length_798_cov_1.028612_1_plen_51_part_01
MVVVRRAINLKGVAEVRDFHLRHNIETLSRTRASLRGWTDVSQATVRDPRG